MYERVCACVWEEKRVRVHSAFLTKQKKTISEDIKKTPHIDRKEGQTKQKECIEERKR